MENQPQRKLLRINTLKGSYKGAWEEIRVTQPIPRRRCYHSACIYQDKLVIYGGQDFSEGVFGDLWVLYLSPLNAFQERWVQLISSGDVPGELCRHSSIVYKDSMFVFGGNNGTQENNCVFIFDFPSNTWRRIEGQVPCIDSHSAVNYNQQMVVFGGYIGGSMSNETYTFDLENFVWAKLDTLNAPSARVDHRSVVHDHFMYVFGGKDSESQLDELWRLDLQSFHWEKVQATGESPGAVCGHSACAYGDVMLVFGGIKDILKETNEMHTFDFRNNHWVLIQTESQIEDPVTSAEVDSFNKKSKKKDMLEPSRLMLYNGPPSPMQGRIKDKFPHSRDGHSANLFENAMIVFGGDRHQMAFNDSYSYSISERNP